MWQGGQAYIGSVKPRVRVRVRVGKLGMGSNWVVETPIAGLGEEGV